MAEALVNSGQAAEAYRTHALILERMRSKESAGSRRLLRAEAGLFYKMSLAAGQQRDQRDAQIRNLQQALHAVRTLETSLSSDGYQPSETVQSLEKKILADLRQVRESMETRELQWI